MAVTKTSPSNILDQTSAADLIALINGANLSQQQKIIFSQIILNETATDKVAFSLVAVKDNDGDITGYTLGPIQFNFGANADRQTGAMSFMTALLSANGAINYPISIVDGNGNTVTFNNSSDAIKYVNSDVHDFLTTDQAQLSSVTQQLIQGALATSAGRLSIFDSSVDNFSAESTTFSAALSKIGFVNDYGLDLLALDLGNYAGPNPDYSSGRVAALILAA